MCTEMTTGNNSKKRNISKEPIVRLFFWPTTLSPFTLKINAEPLAFSLPPALSVNKQIVSLEVHTLSSITVIPL